MDKSLFARKYQPLQQRDGEIENELPQLRAELDVLRINHLSQEDVISNARNLYDRWPELGEDEKRRIAETVVERIVIGQGELEFAYHYAPPPTPSQPSQNEQRLLRACAVVRRRDHSSRRSFSSVVSESSGSRGPFLIVILQPIPRPLDR